MPIRPPPQRPMKQPIRLPNRQIIDAGKAPGHQALCSEFPVLVAVATERGPRPSAARQVVRRQQCLGIRQQRGAAHAQRRRDLQHGRQGWHVLSALDFPGM